MNENLPLILPLALGVAIFLAMRFFIARPGIRPQEAAELARRGEAVIIDVREPAEWASGVAAPAQLLPLSDLRGPRKRWDAFLRKNRNRRLVLYCHSGMRSAQAAALLRREGHAAVNLGSLHRWSSAGLPIRKP